MKIKHLPLLVRMSVYRDTVETSKSPLSPILRAVRDLGLTRMQQGIMNNVLVRTFGDMVIGENEVPLSKEYQAYSVAQARYNDAMCDFRGAKWELATQLVNAIKAHELNLQRQEQVVDEPIKI